MNNKAFSYLLILFLASFLAFDLSGQAGMQRIFNADERDIINSCNSPLNGGGFYLVNFFNEPSTAQADSIGINITKHEPKGDLSWSKDYMIEDADYGYLNKIIACETTTGDSLYVMAVDETTLEEEGAKFMFKIDPEGAVVWSSKMTDIDTESSDVDYGSYPVILSGLEKNTNFLATHNSGDTVAVHVENLDSMMNTNWANSYHAYAGLDSAEVNLALVNAVMSRDSGYVITTAVGDNGLLGGILDLDSLGVPRVATSYRIDDPTIDFSMEFSALAATPDTGMVIVGTCQHDFTFNGIVVKLDSLYNVAWAKQIGTSPGGINVAGDVVISESGEIVVVGKSFNGLSSIYYSVIMDLDGTVTNSWEYSSDESFFADLQGGIIPGIDLNNDPTDGTMHFTSTAAMRFGMGLAPVWIKMEQDGAAMCQDSLTPSLTDITLVRDTLGILISQFAERSDLDIRVEDWDNYDVPIVNLQDTTYCPQDPIMYTIDATTDNAAAYAWSTGDTTATTFVTEEGEYSVTVTMEDRICFTLCDTVMVSQQDFPIISLGFNDSRYCQDKEFDLTVGSTTGTAGGVEWDNGPGTAVFSTENTIAIAHEPSKLYSVTITDNCGNMADTTFVVPNYVPVSNVDFGQSNRALCEFGVLFISADWPDGYTPLNFMWEGGEVTQELRVADPGTYRVTITDNCGHTAADEVTVSPEDFDVPDPTVSIIEAGLNCGNGFPSIVLTADGQAGRPDIGITYMWSTGSDQTSLLVNEPGVYSVIVTDDCGQTVSDQIEITADDLFVPAPTVSIAVSDISPQNCTITLTAQGSAGSGLTLTQTQWNTGNLTSSVAVDGPGTYEVVVTDNCGQTAASSVVLIADDFEIPTPEVSIVPVDDMMVDSCQIRLAAIHNVEGAPTFMWSTGETTEEIVADGYGVFTVTVSTCGQDAIAAFERTQDSDIRWPNIFFPQRPVHDSNKTFGPQIDCPENFPGNYSLEIFNRWGKKVFNTDNIADRWRGTLNNQGNFLEEDVYMYQWSYAEGEVQSGHVTMIRN